MVKILAGWNPFIQNKHMWQGIHAEENCSNTSYNTSSSRILLLPIKRPHFCSLSLDPSRLLRLPQPMEKGLMWLLRQGHKSAPCPRLLFLGCLLLDISYSLWETQAARGKTRIEGSEAFPSLLSLLFWPVAPNNLPSVFHPWAWLQTLQPCAEPPLVKQSVPIPTAMLTLQICEQNQYYCLKLQNLDWFLSQQ